jgi:hypothetical protein
VVAVRTFSPENFPLQFLSAVWLITKGETYQSPREISMESGTGNILVAEEISAGCDTLGAAYKVLGRVFRFRNFALLDTKVGCVGILLKNSGYTQSCS